MFRIRLLTGLIFLTAAAALTADEKAKVPAAADQEKALKLVKDLFKAQYAKTAVADRLALAKKLYDQGMDTKDDVTGRYVLLKEARSLAAGAGDLKLTAEIGEQMTKLYDISKTDATIELYEQMAASAADPTTAYLYTLKLLHAFDLALADDEFELAEKLYKLADTTAKKSKSTPAYTSVTFRSKDVENHRKERQKIQPQIDALQSNPIDPALNHAVGMYFALVKGNWVKALPLLSKSNDEKIKTLASKDLEEPTDAAKQMELGDGWYDLIVPLGKEAAGRKALQLRAYHWYEKAENGLTGLNKTRVQKRVLELEKVATAKQDLTDMWLLIRERSQNKAFTKTNLAGGGDTTFDEFLPEGGLFIGFHYSLGKFFDQPVMRGFQPIFMTPMGEKLGINYGLPKGGKLLTVKAKPGYAIGEIHARGGLGWDAIKVTFYKIEKDKLNKADSYTSEHVGGMGGGETTFGGDGSFIIGIHGKKNREGFVGGFGVLIVKPDGLEPKKK